MAAEGNQWWKLRSKHGRDKLFATPELMWEAACEYFQWCEDNPIISIEIYGKDAIECQVPKMRAFTINGLTQYLGCSVSYFSDFRLRANETHTDFLDVISRIYETIYNQKFTGAAAGLLNANIIARDLGLVEKKQVDTNEHTKVVLYMPDNGRSNSEPAQIDAPLPTLTLPPSKSFEEADAVEIPASKKAE